MCSDCQSVIPAGRFRQAVDIHNISQQHIARLRFCGTKLVEPDILAARMGSQADYVALISRDIGQFGGLEETANGRPCFTFLATHFDRERERGPFREDETDDQMSNILA